MIYIQILFDFWATVDISAIVCLEIEGNVGLPLQYGTKNHCRTLSLLLALFFYLLKSYGLLMGHVCGDDLAIFRMFSDLVIDTHHVHVLKGYNDMFTYFGLFVVMI